MNIWNNGEFLSKTTPITQDLLKFWFFDSFIETRHINFHKEDGSRDFEASDFKKYEKLFIPPAYRDEIYGFIQTCVAKKEEIGRKVTDAGLIAITNWHLLAG